MVNSSAKGMREFRSVGKGGVELAGSGRKGLFVVLEGIDGSGKTTVGKEVVRHLNRNDIKAKFTSEPSNLPIGKLLRRVLNGDIEVDTYTHALLFAADREEHLRREVLPMLEEGNVVVCDRYVYASMAYQGARGVDMEYIWGMNSALPHFRVPGLIILLDVEPEASLRRTIYRKGADIFETPAYLSRVRENYLQLRERHGFVVIDAGARFREVVEQVLDRILTRLEDIEV